MNKLLLVFLFAAFSFSATSQKVYFIYLQSESQQPFFVKMNDKVYSSSSTGYLILSKLYDTTYNIRVGFPQGKWPEQEFAVAVGRKDHGYLLKDFGEKGWGLFDLQALSVQMSSSSALILEEKPKAKTKDVSAFTEMLSKASDDPSLKEKPVVQKPEEKPIVKTETKAEPTVEIVKKEEHKLENKDSVVKKPVEELKAITKEQPEIAKAVDTVIVKEVRPEPKEQPVVSIPEKKAETEVKNEELKKVMQVPKTISEAIEDVYLKSVVTKRSESSTTEGFGLIFIDNYETGIRDTIRLLIPNPKPIAGFLKEESKEEKKFLEIPTNPQPAQAKTLEQEKPKIEEKQVEKPVEVPALPANCPAVADEADFFKLRKAMAAAEGDDEMIAEAKKYFKLKCFTTDRIKNLSTLFLNDEGKYNFFDAAYKYVINKTEFAMLQAELKDEYYINRFKAMIR
ncbi:MAG: hypothetical protein JNK27_09805 [Chitinophagaceae bacterium]|nr:hypothetical protein [Chitinophagaceae bacterium]